MSRNNLLRIHIFVLDLPRRQAGKSIPAELILIVGTFLTRFAEKNGLPKLNAHAFRHTMASILFMEGMDSVSVSARLGHAQVSTTANIYAHSYPKRDQDSVEKLEHAFDLDL